LTAMPSNAGEANIWEPFVANGRKALGSKATVLAPKNLYSETFNVVVPEAYQAKNAKVTIAFLRALLDAERWLKANRDEAIAVVGKAVGLKAPELAEVWNDYVFELVLDKRTLDGLTNTRSGASTPATRRAMREPCLTFRRSFTSYR
jgi:ABC-type nitrate/sulfonate/bicarbonate transport system substrate-binding protein